MDSINLNNYPNMTSGANTTTLEKFAIEVDGTSKSFSTPYDQTNFTNSYTVQGICFNSIGGVTYTLISAYKVGSNSVIFMSADNSIYTKIELKGRTDHVGGIASSGSYTYLTGENSNSILRIPDSSLLASYQSATSQANGNITKVGSLASNLISTVSIGFAPEFLAYDTETDYLWAGNFKSTSSEYMYAFSENTISSASSATYITRMQIPSCTQGASFRDGRLILSRSYVRSPNYTSLPSNYVSELYCYSSKSTSSIPKVYMLPPMAEGVIIGATYTYILFESNSTLYTNSMLRCKSVLAVSFLLCTHFYKFFTEIILGILTFPKFISNKYFPVYYTFHMFTDGTRKIVQLISHQLIYFFDGL